MGRGGQAQRHQACVVTVLLSTAVWLRWPRARLASSMFSFGPLSYLGLENGFLVFLVWFAASLFALVLHNVTQALVARALGDPTAVQQGFAGTDPRLHVDPLQLLFMALLGGAFPNTIPLRGAGLRGRGPGSEILVWLSGPLGMILWALLLLIVQVLLLRFGGETASTKAINQGLAAAVMFSVRFAVVFLIPVPPLDGARILWLVGNESVRRVLQQVEAMGFLGFFVIFFILSATGILSVLTQPILAVLLAIAQVFG
jgi:Zn-dependent protease